VKNMISHHGKQMFRNGEIPIMKNKNYRLSEQFQIQISKIVERGKIDILNTHIGLLTFMA